MVMFAFDLNVVPIDEDQLLQQRLLLENRNNNCQLLLPFKKRVFKDLYKDDDINKDFSLPLKKRLSMRVTHLDICDAPAQKRLRVDDAVCLDPTTLPIEHSVAVAFAPGKKRLKINYHTNKSTDQSAIMPSNEKKRRRPVIESSDIAVDATKLLPEHIRNDPKFKDMTDVKLVIQKRLTKCDIDKHQDRLAIPSGQIVTTEFLTKSESNWLIEEPLNAGKGKGKKRGLGVKVIGPCSSSNDLQVHNMSISRWNYNSDGFRYVLKGKWFAFTDEYKLQSKDLIQIVSFRCNNRIHMAILNSKA